MDHVTVSKHLADNYTEYYRNGDSVWRRLGSLQKVKNMVELCQHLSPTKVIEIGAGEGANLRRQSAMNLGEKLWADEISPSGVKAITEKRIPNLVDCKVFDGYHIPYANKEFNLAVLSHVLEHVEHPRLLIYEAARVADYVFVEVPLEDTVRLRANFTFDAVGHIDAHSMRSIRRLPQSCGLVVERQITTNPEKRVYTYQKGYKRLVNFYIKELLLKISPTFASRIFTYHAALLCRLPEHPPLTNDELRSQ